MTFKPYMSLFSRVRGGRYGAHKGSGGSSTVFHGNENNTNFLHHRVNHPDKSCQNQTGETFKPLWWLSRPLQQACRLIYVIRKPFLTICRNFCDSGVIAMFPWVFTTCFRRYHKVLGVPRRVSKRFHNVFCGTIQRVPEDSPTSYRLNVTSFRELSYKFSRVFQEIVVKIFG